MDKQPKLQAHRGVSTEYPENTMAAFEAAVLQGYDVIELDPNYTADNKLVVLHDKTVNRTARSFDSTVIEKPLFITDITYNHALEYDYGVSFSKKFKGEKIPLLEQALRLAKEKNVTVKLDNKIEAFPKQAADSLYSLIREFEAWVAITSNNVEMIKFYAQKFPKAQLHYDGAVDEKVLSALSAFSVRLTVWLPYRSALTSWVSFPFADERLCSIVKKYAKLGIWMIDDYKSYEYICEKYDPDIVETTGAVKPEINAGALCDMHVHSQNSHDSTCSVIDAAGACIKNNVSVFAVTDHCDIQYYLERDMLSCIKNSIEDAEREAENFSGKVEILKGIEIGEGIWNKKYTDEILGRYDFDVILGSVHAVRYQNYTAPYSTIDFSKMKHEELDEYLKTYFDEVFEMLEQIPCDIMAHLTCPLRYINGKYNMNIDVTKYKDKICRILEYIIAHSVAMELNTSGGCGDFMPDEWIVKMFKDMGGYLITLGSDAHISENVGKDFEKAIGLLKKYGYKNYYYYQNRKNIQCGI